MKTEMKNSTLIIIYFFFLILTGSCSCGRNQESDSSQKNDSAINNSLKVLVDSTLVQHLGLELDSFIISESIRNNDTIKDIKGTGRSRFYGNEKLSITGSYENSQNNLICKSLKAIHADVGNVFEIDGKYDTLLVYRMDSITFLKKNLVYQERRIEKINDYYNRIERAYSNQTKVHFGISREEYKRLGEYFQRNFYEGLVGSGAYELAKPIFSKGIFVGFEIMEINDKAFIYNNVQRNADVIRQEQLNVTADSFLWYYYCNLYNMKIISRYDKFKKRNVLSLVAYWNEYLVIYNF